MGQYDWLRTLPIFSYPEPPIVRKPLLKTPPYTRPNKPATLYDTLRKSQPIILYDNVTKNKTPISRHRRISAYNANKDGVYLARAYSPALDVLVANPKEGHILLGIELELESPADVSNGFYGMRLATETYLDKRAILVTDVSLHSRGAEINSIPMSESEYRVSRHLWHKYLLTLSSQYKYVPTHRCGLHTHISSNFMPAHYWGYLQRWMCLPAQSYYFMRISGRTPDIGNGFHFCEFINDSSKYRALNIMTDSAGMPTPTREFRFFAGTAKPSLFFNSIETYLLLAKWGALKALTSEDTLLNFLEYCRTQVLYPSTGKWLLNEYERIESTHAYRSEIVPEQPAPRTYTRPDMWTLADDELEVHVGYLPTALVHDDTLWCRTRKAIWRCLENTNCYPVSPDNNRGSWWNLEISFDGFWDKRIKEWNGSEHSPGYIRVWSLTRPEHRGIRLTRYRGGWGRCATIHYSLY